jgi:hypothetical protein
MVEAQQGNGNGSCGMPDERAKRKVPGKFKEGRAPPLPEQPNITKKIKNTEPFAKVA